MTPTARAALTAVSLSLTPAFAHRAAHAADPPLKIASVQPGESVFQYVKRVQGRIVTRLCQQIIGSAGPYKEGDETIGVAAADEASRENARKLLAATKISELVEHPLLTDPVSLLITKTTDAKAYARVKGWSIAKLKDFVLTAPEGEIHAVMPGLPSDAIASVVKLMSNDELIRVGQKVFNPLPGGNLGAKGYLGARVQPNSPTDLPEDVAWQVFDAWSFGVGDLMLGNNPVGSTLPAITGVELALKDVIHSFGLEKVLPWVVLSHIKIQDQVETAHPGSTALYFQSIAGTETANQVFEITTAEMQQYAANRRKQGPYGLYLETGQGSEVTNGEAHGVDMGTLEARKYGMARALKQEIGPEAWVALNDVAGFIGPEVFRTREQLVRVALEDTVMGKLHGLAIGLDICATLHMPIGLDDLDWAIERILPANPAYLMALPTKNDPMLSYLTTDFQRHVWARAQFGYKVNEPMWEFFKKLGVIDAQGKPTAHFGDPIWVYVQYRKAKGDTRSDSEIYAEGRVKSEAVIKRGVPLAIGTGEKPWDTNPALKAETEKLVDAAKKAIYLELPPSFVHSQIPGAVELKTRSADRTDYIWHPPTGEQLDDASLARVRDLAAAAASHDAYDTEIVVSDGLNASAITDPGHLAPFLAELRTKLAAAGLSVAPETLVVHNGRVRAGYEIGRTLFGADATPGAGGNSPKTIVHVIGERPGTPHENYSVYVSTAMPATWAMPEKPAENGGPSGVNHDKTRVISGVSDTALDPRIAAGRAVDEIVKTAETLKCRQEALSRLP